MAQRRDNIFLMASVIGMILWIKFFHKIPADYFWLYALLLPIIIIPFLYLIHLKRQVYQWSLEAIFHMIFLTFLGIISFAFSIMGIDPFLFFR